MFDELADAYERFRTGYAPEVYDTVVASGLTQGSRVLDVGCGTGIASEALAQRGCVLTGVDVSEPMLQHARQRLPDSTFVTARAEALPFERASFDGSISAQAFHWFDHDAALAELARVVRPGGVIAVWWKALMRGDPVRMLRDETARELGLDPPRSLPEDDFAAFERAPLAGQRLRVIPWTTRVSVKDFMGYERSRARSKAAYGDALPRYFERLSARLGNPDGTLTLSYIALLYLAHVPVPA